MERNVGPSGDRGEGNGERWLRFIPEKKGMRIGSRNASNNAPTRGREREREREREKERKKERKKRERGRREKIRGERGRRANVTLHELPTLFTLVARECISVKHTARVCIMCSNKFEYE